MRAPSISLIVSTYNNPAALEEIFLRLEAGTERPGQVVVADDGSGAATRGLIERWSARGALNITHCWHADLGFRKTSILNQSVARAEGEYIVFLDGDCLPTPRFVADHRRLAEKGFFVQGRRAFVKRSAVERVLERKARWAALFFGGKLSGVAKAFRWPVPVIRRNRGLRGLIGCNLALWRDDLLCVNGFDEAYEGWGKEDSDVCVRLYHAGLFRKFVYGRAIVYHLNHPVVDRARVPENERRLQETIDSKRVRCARGVDQYLNKEAAL